MVQTIFLRGNTILADGLMPPHITLRQGFIESVLGTAFFCPECGDVWGRICNYHTPSFTVRVRRCRQHGNGIFLLGNEIWKRYPKEVLKHDFLIMSAPNAAPFYNYLYDWK